LLKIQVIDNGIGIATSDIPKLFSRFGRLESSRHLNPNGIGLGLYTCKGICKALDGELYCESNQQEHKTVFTALIKFTLPCQSMHQTYS
jgi:signal transduction histidine kinase